MGTLEAHRLLVMGSAEEFVGLVALAGERGIQTVVCDANPEGPAKALANVAYNVDIRDTEELSSICAREQVDGIITAYSDVLAENYVKVAQAAGLPAYLSPEGLAPLRDKARMKALFDKLDVPYPKTRLVHKDTLEKDFASLCFPCVTKPLGAWGSHGVFLCKTVEEIEAVFEKVEAFQEGDAILVEEYDDGHELNVMTWILDGQAVVLDIADREKSHEIEGVTPHVSRIVYPSRLTDVVLDEVRAIATRVARGVGMNCGPLCMQAFWSTERGLRVCECAGRIFGYEHELLEIASNGHISIEELLLDYVYDRDALQRLLQAHDPHLSCHAAVLDFHGYEGRVASVQGVPEEDPDQGIVYSKLCYRPGDVISHAVGARPYVVELFTRADTREELDVLDAKLFSEVRVLDGQGRNLIYHNELNSYDDVRDVCHD